MRAGRSACSRALLPLLLPRQGGGGASSRPTGVPCPPCFFFCRRALQAYHHGEVADAERRERRQACVVLGAVFPRPSNHVAEANSTRSSPSWAFFGRGCGTTRMHARTTRTHACHLAYYVVGERGGGAGVAGKPESCFTTRPCQHAVQAIVAPPLSPTSACPPHASGACTASPPPSPIPEGASRGFTSNYCTWW